MMHSFLQSPKWVSLPSLVTRQQFVQLISESAYLIHSGCKPISENPSLRSEGFYRSSYTSWVNIFCSTCLILQCKKNMKINKLAQFWIFRFEVGSASVVFRFLGKINCGFAIRIYSQVHRSTREALKMFSWSRKALNSKFIVFLFAASTQWRRHSHHPLPLHWCLATVGP